MKLNRYFADLHIHIGRDWYGKPVKITGSRTLTLTNVVKEASRRKGLDLIGVIDAQSPAVQEELLHLIESGEAVELEEGGIRYEDTVLLLGSEIEIYDASCHGPIHVLCYFPYVEQMREFTMWLGKKMKNTSLSSQRFYGTGRELQEYVKANGGIFIPAHIFTPFKSLYGKGVAQTLREVLNPEMIDAVELGLSADTSMANQIDELEAYTYVTNSDAHSLGKMAREYQEVYMLHPSFDEFRKALNETEGRSVSANFGMDPRMGKYHQTVCQKCTNPTLESECPQCGSTQIVKGVADRIAELSGDTQTRKRPPYYYQVPLSSIPGIGLKTYEKLLDTFKSEMDIIHSVSYEQLLSVIPDKTAGYIMDMREGRLEISMGGGGVYGKVKQRKQ